MEKLRRMVDAKKREEDEKKRMEKQKVLMERTALRIKNNKDVAKATDIFKMDKWAIGYETDEYGGNR